MTIWYFDPVNGKDSNNGTSKATPKQNYTTAGSNSNDVFLFKRGTTLTITSDEAAIRSGTSDTARGRYGAYDTAQVPYAILRYGGTKNRILNGAGSKYVDFEDLYFDMRNSNCHQSVYCASQGNAATVGNSFRRCFFRGSNAPAKGGGSGLEITQELTSTAWPRDYLIEECEFFDNDTHGLLIVGARNIQVRDCKFYRNGAQDPTGGHGFSARWNLTNLNVGSPWTKIEGSDIWWHQLEDFEQDVYYVKVSDRATEVRPVYTRVHRTAGNPTTPELGEYGVSEGSLYINLGDVLPNKKSISYAWGRCSGLLVEHCQSYHNRANASAPFHEGHGFAFDDFTEDSFFSGNLSHDNEGAGFSINSGDRNTIIGNVAYGNWQSALVNNPSGDTRVINNTFYNNNTHVGERPRMDGEIAVGGEILFNPGCRDAVVSNNIIISSAQYGISCEATDSGFTGSTNDVVMSKGATVEKTPFIIDTILVDPQLDSGYRPKAAAVKRAGSYVGGGKDFYGNEFGHPPSIGAVEDGFAPSDGSVDGSVIGTNPS